MMLAGEGGSEAPIPLVSDGLELWVRVVWEGVVEEGWLVCFLFLFLRRGA